jgi:hypothetical protein
MASRDTFFVLSVLEPWVQRRDMHEEELRMKPDIPRMGLEGGRVHSELELAIQRARRDGQTLERSLQEQMGTCLGHDFSKVRVHTDPKADELSRQLSAKAFTIGSDIFFKRGAYAPASMSGRELIAHELVHVVQQSTGRVNGHESGVTVRSAHDAFEHEADTLALRVAREGETAGADAKAPGSRPTTCIIQRTTDTFIRRSKTAPPRIPTVPPYQAGVANCHEAALYWMLLDEGTYYPQGLLAAIKQTVSPGNQNIPGHWFARLYTHNLTGIGAPPVRIRSMEQLRTAVRAGDILITGTPVNPSHTMVLVKITKRLTRWWVYIRGFNNVGSLGTGPRDAYDNADRDIHKQRYWHPRALALGGPAAGPPDAHQGFGRINPVQIWGVAFGQYRQRVLRVRDLRSNRAGGAWQYQNLP